MDPRQRLFRKAALDKMASPERLDEMMHVTSPAGWLALAALGVILGAGILWGLFGSISIKVHGQGILLRGDAVLDVTSGASGRLVEIVVGTGDDLEVGDVVARIEQPDLELQIANAQEELRTLRSQQGQQASSSSRVLAQLETQRRELRAKVQSQQDLVDRGLLTRGTLIATQSQLSSVEQNIAAERSRRSSGGNRGDDIERRIRELESRLSASTVITSPYGGRVLELMVDPGNLVAPGSRLLTLEAVDDPIEAVVFVPAANGKKVRPGMEVRLAPSTHKSEEFGFILGDVEDVSVFPATPEGILRTLRNRSLADELSGQGPKIEVSTELRENPDTPSGFQWTSSEGPPDSVYSGTLCQASIVVERKRPIAYVLPILKKAVSG